MWLLEGAFTTGLGAGASVGAEEDVVSAEAGAVRSIAARLSRGACYQY